jgi:glycosyltransferase involved in cell wall biosynthesis
MPSKYEGHPISLVEAMFAQTPIIASDLPVFHEVLGNAAQYASQDISEWKQAMIKYVRAPKETKQRTEIAYSRANDLFHPKVISEEYKQVYDRILK